MASRRPRPLFSATPVVYEDVPDESQHPQSLTARIRRWLLTDPEPLFRAEQRQAEYQRKLEESDPQPRN
jgi:hypothetical protein